MKTLFHFIITNFLVFGLNAQWLQQNSGTTNLLTEVYFINENVGFVVGQKTILKTIDGGLNWQESFAGEYFMEGIYFADSLNGFAIGYDLINGAPSIIQTNNSGKNWTTDTLLSGSFLFDIYFVNSKTGFIVGSGGKAFKTIDGGKNWKTLNTGISSTLEGVYFTDTLNGIIVGGFIGTALILQTVDGGESWVKIQSPIQEFLQGVFFSSKNIGYAVGWNGAILKTTDGGNSWLPQTSVDANGNLDVYFINDSVGYIVGGSQNYAGIQKTTDGGTNWSAQIAPVNAGLIAVFFPKDETGFCVGANGQILKTTNGGITKTTDAINKKANISIYPNPSNAQTTIDLKGTECRDCLISFYDVQGKLVDNFPFESSSQSINILDLKTGTYFIAIRGKDVNLNIPFVKE